MDEEVLVFPAAVLERAGEFHGFTDRVDHYLPILLDPANLLFMPRSKAETDPSYKQLVPYAALRHENSVFCYQRGKSGGEARLHERLSLGVGGHISREDGDIGLAAYEVGYARELEEEVAIATPYEQRIAGLVYDPTTPVGQVHVGIIHVLDLAEPNVEFRDPALADARFLALEEIHRLRDRFETWSHFVIDHVLNQPSGAAVAS